MGKVLDFFKHNWRNLVAGVVVLAVIISSTVVVIRNRNTKPNNETADLSRSDIVNQFTPQTQQPPEPPQQPQTPSPQPSSPEIPQVSGTSPRGPQQQTGAVLGTATIQPTLSEYKNDSWRFRVSIPGGTIVNSQGNTITAHPEVGRGVYWTVNVYENTKETLSSIERQLNSSPSVSRVGRTTFAGQPALEFRSPNIGGLGRAVIYQNRLYYLIGNFTDFQFI